jgi:hypothetical protein
MKFKILNIVFILIIFNSVSCVKRPNLSREELIGYNIYNKNDTIIFQNLTSKIKDTTIIINKQKYHSYEPMVNTKYIYHYANIEYKNNSIKNPNSAHTAFMFTLCKTDYSSLNPINFNYLNSYFKLDEKTEKQTITLFLSNKKIDNAYFLVYDKPKFSSATEDSPNILYWDMNFGIVKYITFKGEIWERVNW